MDMTIKLWQRGERKSRYTFEGFSEPIGSFIFSPNGQILVCGDNTKIKIWDTYTGELLQTLEGHINTVTVLVFSPDGETFASGSSDDTIMVWRGQ